MTFDAILRKCNNDTYSERDKGTSFEELISSYLMS